tara:strand:- start:2475 stop:3929 length:1455 start_codon:yes stop_codon:yes gene_type:complete
MKNKKVIYTAIFGEYDKIIDPIFIPKGWDFICFTDSEIKSEIWEVRKVEGLFKDPTRNARRYKVLPHRWFKEYDYSLWIDGNILLREDINELIPEYLKNVNIAVHNHNENKDKRNCVYEEVKALVDYSLGNKKYKDDPDIVLRQKDKYISEGYPSNNGLAVTMQLLRRHNEKDCIVAMEKWWEEIDFGSKRDQLSFNYALWKTKTKFNYFKGDSRNNKHFLHSNHKGNKKLSDVLFENTPYRTDLDLIKSYNSFMKLLPDDGWAVFRDGDTLFLDSYYGKVIEEAIKENPDTDCFTCYTNRVGCEWQVYNEYDGDDIVKHRTISNKIKNIYSGEYLDVTNREDFYMSGVVMILSKKAWKKIGGFKEWSSKKGRTLGIDNRLYIDLRNNGFKIKLIKGLYIYHWYRGGNKEDKSHLTLNNHVITNKKPKNQKIKKITVSKTESKNLIDKKLKDITKEKPKNIVKNKPKIDTNKKFINIRRTVRVK